MQNNPLLQMKGLNIMLVLLWGGDTPLPSTNHQVFKQAQNQSQGNHNFQVLRTRNYVCREMLNIKMCSVDLITNNMITNYVNIPQDQEHEIK